MAADAMRDLVRGLAAFLIAAGAGASADVVAPPASGPAPTSPNFSARPPTSSEPTSRPAVQLPGLRVDLVRREVQVDARVVFDPRQAAMQPADPNQRVPADGGWLELIACLPGMREYESLVAVACQPRHLHQALLMVGLEPGAPLQVEHGPEGIKATPPHGPLVEVTVRYRVKDVVREEPVARWVIDRRTGAALADSEWLFTGSVWHRVEQREIYLADLNGSVVSLVNFGDELVCRRTGTTHRDDGQVFAADVKRVPPLGTAVTLCLRPARAAQRAGSTSRPARPTSQPSRPAPTPPADAP